MTRRNLLGAAIAASFLFAGNAFAQASQTYTPGSFDRFVVSGIAKVELSQGDRDSITVMGDAEVQRGVQIDLTRSGELRVSTEGDWKFWDRSPVVLRVQMRDMKQLVISGLTDIVATRPIRVQELRINISGKGEVKLAELQADKLRFEISGAGEGDIAGKVSELQLRVSGAGKLNAEKLKAQVASVVISGAANTDVWVTDELRINVSGVGNVNYWGNPQVKQNVSTMATITSRGDKR